MSLTKKPLTLEEIDSQAAFELPDRETMLVTVVIVLSDVLREVTIIVRDVELALQICAILLATDVAQECTVQE